MMVETILESSQDFSMSNGALPQWKRELLQRRAARSRPPPPAAPHAPPAPAADEDEELRYGPGIVKRLKSRYLSLALRDAPRRRPSVLRRAASLEHLLDERPPPAPRPEPRLPRPASLHSSATIASAARRESVKRARSVDALSRLDSREDARAPSPPPPPPPRPPASRAARPPRRPAPLLRDTERPPPDVVRSTLRKFEPTPTRRAPCSSWASGVQRCSEPGAPRSSTPEPREREPSPASGDLSAIASPECGASGARGGGGARLVSRAALDSIARAGSSVRYSFGGPAPGCAPTHLPPLSATNPVLLGRARASPSPRRVGVIRPMPPPALDHATELVVRPPYEPVDKSAESPLASPRTETPSPRLRSPPPVTPPPPPPSHVDEPSPRPERKDPPPSAFVEPIPRSPPEPEPAVSPRGTSPALIEATPDSAPILKHIISGLEKAPIKEKAFIREKPMQEERKPVNGEREPERVLSRLGGADTERAWSGAGAGGAGGRRARPPPAAAAVSVVFNFSNRKEVPDYIENDGLILCAGRKNRIKTGSASVAAQQTDSEDEGDAAGGAGGGRAPSPCGVRFVNDNVLINGRSSMPPRPNKDRISKLKLQFDDSLTRTHEYPSETSLCEEAGTSPPAAASLAPPAPAPAPPAQLAEPALLAPLANNTHIASGTLGRYTPHKTRPGAFELGLASHASHVTHKTHVTHLTNGNGPSPEPPADPSPSPPASPSPSPSPPPARWSEARTHATDLLF